MPGEMLPLHIFEERYRQMISDVEAGDRLFGITFFDPQDDFVERPITGSVGCVAEVREVDLLEDGRSNIITLGRVRYRLLDYIDSDELYLTGEVEIFEDDLDMSDALSEMAEEVFELFKRVAQAAFKMGGSRGELPELQQTDPESLSFLVSAGFNFDNEMKVRLIEMTSTSERLSKLRDILSKTVAQIEESADIQVVARTNGHSKKKLDL